MYPAKTSDAPVAGPSGTRKGRHTVINIDSDSESDYKPSSSGGAAISSGTPITTRNGGRQISSSPERPWVADVGGFAPNPFV